MYCVEWNTRKARPARKSRDDRSPATGLSVNPVQSNVIIRVFYSMYLKLDDC